MNSKGYAPLPTDIIQEQPSLKEDPMIMKSQLNRINKVPITQLQSVVETQKLTTDSQGNFIESLTGRRIQLHGINLASSAKLPAKPFTTSYTRPKECGFYDEADHVSFVGKPFPLEDAYEHLTRIKLWGHNIIRYIIPWEAIEHEGPGIYDDDFIDYTIELFKIIKEIGGLYVFIDPHQDVWSRFCGGSGAPLWTLYAAGLEPKHFWRTGAATLHNTCKDPANYTKMVWATNYYRLATEVMFTMFFSGKLFFPKAIIDGMNIQDYLQDHLLNAFDYLLKETRRKAPQLFETTIIGIETMNEPNKGLYGFTDLSQFPPDQELKLDASPTAIQSMRLGMGIPQEVDVYQLSVFGPRKKGTKVLNPKGLKAWIDDDSMDKHYGFNRDKGWKLGECLFAQHDIWDIASAELIIPDYFAIDPNDGKSLSMNTFVNDRFVEFWSKFKRIVNNFSPEMFTVMQAPVFEIPPNLKGTSLVDSKTISAQHYYDGMSLMFKTWNRKYNVDTLGIIRGRYINPVFGIVFGESNIRRSIRNQLGEMKRESNEKLGEQIPVIMSEVGMPFDMDDKKAYKDGDYGSQESANDAILFALEGNALNFTYWCYNPESNHKWGDNWNLEDFSLYSKDDSHDPQKDLDSCKFGSYIDWITNSVSDLSSSNSVENKSKLSSVKYFNLEAKNTNDKSSYMPVDDLDMENRILQLLDGTRVCSAIMRPYSISANGVISYSEFDLAKQEFILIIDTNAKHTSRSNSPTTIFLPEMHFPLSTLKIEVTSGSTEYKYNRFLQLVEWKHEVGIGNIKMTVTNTDPDEEYTMRVKGKSGPLNFLTCGCL